MTSSPDDSLPKYEISFSSHMHWYAGYHPEHDEIFIYSIDRQGVVSVFRKGGLDAMGFWEFMDFSKAELLGEL